MYFICMNSLLRRPASCCLNAPLVEVLLRRLGGGGLMLLESEVDAEAEKGMRGEIGGG